MYGIPGEDEYWENRREEWEKPRAYRKHNVWDEDEPVYENGNLFLDGEIEEIEREHGYSMQELYEGDLLEIVEKYKGVIADSAEWNSVDECIKYRYQVA